MLAHRLAENRFVDTVPSMASDAFAFGPNNQRLLDLPGHSRLRTVGLDQISSARVVVFVFGRPPFSDACEYLYDVLERVQRVGVDPLLVLCFNFNDKDDSSVETCISRVNAEMEALRSTRATLRSTSAEDDYETQDVSLGVLGKSFEITQDAGISEVICVRTSAKNGDVDDLIDVLA